MDEQDKSTSVRYPVLLLLFLLQNNIFYIFRFVPVDAMRTFEGNGAKFQAY